MNARVPVWLDRAVALIIFLTLALGLVLPKVAGAGFLLSGLIAIVWLSLNHGWRLSDLSPLERLMLMAVALYVLVWIAGWLVNGLRPEGADAVSRILRLLLIIPLLLFVRRLDGVERAWWLGLTLGAAIAGIYALWFFLTGDSGGFEVRVSGTTNPIYFGGIALAMGLMLLPRVQDPNLPVRHRVLTAFAILLAIAASALSGSRGAWLALPPLLIVYLFTLGANQPWRWRFGVPAFLTLITLVIMVSPITPMSQRASAGITDLVAFVEGHHSEGTIGRRVGLWQTAGDVIREHPLTGGGPGSFPNALAQAVAEGRLGEHLLNYEHPHNEYLSALVQAGVPGLAALLLMLAIAIKRLARVWHTGLQGTRYLGWSGLAGLTTIAVMGLSESLFERNIGIVWFSFFTAVSLALVHARRRQELAQSEIPRYHTLSVIVICKNEEGNIARCLASVSGWADEVIVLDSGSVDRTVEIARQFTDQVDQTDWPGYGVQKQRALDRASSDWVLSLDADEALSEELRREISHVLARPQPYHHGYRLPWLTLAFGRQLSFGHWARAPLRLFRRDMGRFTPDIVHEKVIMPASARVGFLEGQLHHHVYRDISHARSKLRLYAERQASQRFEAGKRVRLTFSPYLRAIFNLVDNFVLRAAFLDGRAGWTMSRLYADYTFSKYQRLHQLQASEKTD